jgi:glutathione S-transferase
MDAMLATHSTSPGVHPVLYSFRRCPYAIRARWAVLAAGVEVELREVVLRNKPQALLDVSPKATVPVLVTTQGGATQVIEQSLDVMRWALAQHDPEGWLKGADDPQQQDWVALNDGAFKRALDAYKYPERHPERSVVEHRAEGERLMLAPMNQTLAAQAFLAGERPGLSDVALFPFVRQWAAVDAAAFADRPMPHLQRWVNHWLTSAPFAAVMAKRPAWAPGQAPVYFPGLQGLGLEGDV